MSNNNETINIDEPRYDQEAYAGRARHFFETTNPLNVFATAQKLEEARKLVATYRETHVLPNNVTADDLWRAKTLYDSAFHPESGQKMNIVGRMSAQVPMNMIITGGMMAFYKTTPAVLFWQWFNQSFNALVNYTNRSGDAVASDKQIATSYVLATTGAVGTALGLNRLCKCTFKMSDPCQDLSKIDLSEPRYDQETYWGRAHHFFQTTNPINLFASNESLEDARCLVHKHKCKEPLPPGTTEEDLWHAKMLYDSAYHPDTGELMNVVGRMSAQVPMNMIIVGGMMSFYKSVPAVIFWQWLNQSFNALVNYTNRAGDTASTDKQLMTSYVMATTGAVTTALTLNRLCRNSPPLVGRFVPLAAVVAANCINIPLMRAQELKNGTPIYDECNTKLGYSKNAAQEGISQVIVSRCFMAFPGMILTPFLMNYLERRGTLCRYPWINLPTQIGFVGLCLTFATPLACAFFRQKASIPYKHLEPELREQLNKKFGDHPPKYVYYNKGL